MYFAYNSANTQCITTLTTGVMCTKHLPHSCLSQNVIRKMRMSLDSSFNIVYTNRHPILPVFQDPILTILGVT